MAVSGSGVSGALTKATLTEPDVLAVLRLLADGKALSKHVGELVAAEMRYVEAKTNADKALATLADGQNVATWIALAKTDKDEAALRLSKANDDARRIIMDARNDATVIRTTIDQQEQALQRDKDKFVTDVRDERGAISHEKDQISRRKAELQASIDRHEAEKAKFRQERTAFDDRVRKLEEAGVRLS